MIAGKEIGNGAGGLSVPDWPLPIVFVRPMKIFLGELINRLRPRRPDRFRGSTVALVRPEVRGYGIDLIAQNG